MKQYMLKKWMVLIASLMSISHAFAKGGDIIHVFVKPDAHIVVDVPPAARRVQTPEMGTQTDDVPAPIDRTLEAHPEETSKDEVEHAAKPPKADAAGDSVLISRELFDELVPCAVKAAGDSVTKKTLNERFGIIQDAENLKRAIQLSLDEAEKAKQLALANGEDDLAEALALSEAEQASILSEEDRELARAIAASLLTQSKALLAANIARIRDAARLFLILTTVHRLLQEISRLVVEPQRTCRQEFLAGRSMSPVSVSAQAFGDSAFVRGLQRGFASARASGGGLFAESTPPPMASRPPRPMLQSKPAHSFSGAGLSRGLKWAFGSGCGLFEEKPKPVLKRRVAELQSAPVVDCAASVAAAEPVAAVGVSAKSLEQLTSLLAQMADLRVVFPGGVAVDVVGHGVRHLAEKMSAGTVPSSEEIRAAFDARTKHVKSITKKYASYRKTLAPLVIASYDIVLDVVRIAFQETLKTVHEDARGACLGEMQTILGALNKEKLALMTEFGIGCATIVRTQ